MLNWTEGMESNYIYIKVSISLFYNYLFHTILTFLNVFSMTLPEICSMGINRRPFSPQASVQSPKQFLPLYNSSNCCWSSKCVSDSCDPTDCSPPGPSVCGISQARILEWVTMSFSRGSSWPRDRTHISCIGRWAPPLSHQGRPRHRISNVKWRSETVTLRRQSICLGQALSSLSSFACGFAKVSIHSLLAELEFYCHML